MKAWSNENVLRLFAREGLHFDCSSVYEVMRVIKAGVEPERIELVSQELTRKQLEELRKVPGSEKVKFVASSR
jgi:diaminopimelate decarboxylase